MWPCKTHTDSRQWLYPHYQGDGFGLFLGHVSPLSRTLLRAAWAISPFCRLNCLTPWIREGCSSFTFWKTWVHPRFNSRIQDKEMAKDDMFDSPGCYLSWQCDASHWGQWSTLGHDTVLHALRNASWVGFSLYPETLVSDSHWFFQTAL